MPQMALTEAQVVILYSFVIEYNYMNQSLVCVAYSFHMIYENILSKSEFPQSGHIVPWDHRILVDPYEMIITLETP